MPHLSIVVGSVLARGRDRQRDIEIITNAQKLSAIRPIVNILITSLSKTSLRPKLCNASN